MYEMLRWSIDDVMVKRRNHEAPNNKLEVVTTPDARDVVVGRSKEIEQAKRFVAHAPDGPAALVLAGEAGIGKTTIWEAAVEEARSLGSLVLTARPAEEEILAALLGLSDLVDGTVIGHEVLEPGIDAFERGRRILHALRSVAADTPVVVAVDDLQWLDPDSARSLRYVFRRLEQEAVRLIATWRVGVAGEPPTDPLSVAHAATTRIDLGPLDPVDLRSLLATEWGAVSPLTLRSIRAVSGGNPLYALELARSLTLEERRIGIPEGKALPDSLRDAVGHRLAAVDERLRPVLELVGVAGPLPVSRIEEHFAPIDVGPLLAEAQRLRILTTDGLLRVGFGHPLLASALVEQMGPSIRRALHAELAEVEPDQDLAARHMALAIDTPDEHAAAILEARAENALRTGKPAMAAEFARHSRRLTAPNDAAANHRRTLLEARGLAASGEAGDARRLFDQLIASLPGGPLRSEALIQRFYVENDDLDAGERLLLEAMEHADEPVLRGRIMDLVGWHRASFRGDIAGGLEAAEQAVELLDGADDEDALVWARSHLGHIQAMAGISSHATMESAIEYFGRRGGLDMGGGPRAWLSKQQLWAGDLASVDTGLKAVIANYEERGFTIGLPWRLYDLALLHITAGAFAEAHRVVNEGISYALDTDSDDALGWLYYPQALYRAWCGSASDVAEAADKLANNPGRLVGSTMSDMRAAHAIALSRLAAGRFDQALEVLMPAVEMARSSGLGNPGMIPLVPNAALAAIWSNDMETATQLCNEVASQALSLATPRAAAVHNLLDGLCTAVAGDVDGGLHAIQLAIGGFDALGMRPSGARARLAGGRILLRVGRRTQASDMAEAARKIFASLGATPWEKLASTEVDRTNPGRSDGGLTDQEQRIAALIAEGAKNREIASRLFISVATVEAHLTRLYRKLEIRSRTELARLVVDGTISVQPLEIEDPPQT